MYYDNVSGFLSDTSLFYIAYCPEQRNIFPGLGRLPSGLCDVVLCHHWHEPIDIELLVALLPVVWV